MIRPPRTRTSVQLNRNLSASSGFSIANSSTSSSIGSRSYVGFEDATPRPSIDFPTAVIEVSTLLWFQNS
uniref:Uncharacterized protein n=1 Tax=Caenorhabditis japonica TaxID=281687 RepID=A0A8R1ICZ6_CAEJA